MILGKWIFEVGGICWCHCCICVLTSRNCLEIDAKILKIFVVILCDYQRVSMVSGSAVRKRTIPPHTVPLQTLIVMRHLISCYSVQTDLWSILFSVWQGCAMKMFTCSALWIACVSKVYFPEAKITTSQSVVATLKCLTRPGFFQNNSFMWFKFVGDGWA